MSYHESYCCLTIRELQLMLPYLRRPEDHERRAAVEYLLAHTEQLPHPKARRVRGEYQSWRSQRRSAG